MRGRVWLAVGVVALLLGGGLTIVACRAGEVGLVDGRLRDCPTSPNCVCSEGDQGANGIAALDAGEQPEQGFASLVEFLRQEPRVDLVTVEPRYVHAVFRTPLMRFRDDVEFRLDEEGRIQVRSASRLGYSDLGTNRSRIESIRERWSPGGGAASAPD